MILRYCGRDFPGEHILLIRTLIQNNPHLNRAQLSRIVCEKLLWLRPDGRLKDMSCRVAMLKMHRDGLITMPPPTRKNANGQCRPKITQASDPQSPITLSAGKLGELIFQIPTTPKESSLWNEFIERYHYLSYTPLPGAQIRYLVYDVKGRLLALLGFGAAAWKVAPRDQYIGWSARQRVDNLHLIVNNARFLILPWIKSKNLASRILSAVAKKLPADWKTKYNYSPVALETFVEVNRFTGACYRAANWILLGQTQGRGKLDRFGQRLLPKKYIYLFLLVKNFRYILCDSKQDDSASR